MTLAKPVSGPYPRPQRRRSGVGQIASRAAALVVGLAGLAGVLAIVVLITFVVVAGAVGMVVALFV